jgi:opacity protein-like surface antigen
MKKLGLAALMAAASALPAVASAQQNTMSNQPNTMYGGVGISWLGIEGPGGADGDGIGLRGKLGYTFSPLLAAEAHLGFGVTDGSDTFMVNGTPTSIDLGVDNWIGIYARGQYPVVQNLNVYGLLGLARVSLDFAPYSEDNETDLSWGLGADYSLGEQLGVHVEWTSLLDKSDADISAFTVGANYRF